MFKQGFDIAFKIVKILSILVAPVAVCIGIFALLCVSWFLVFKYYFKLEFKPSGIVPVKKRPLINSCSMMSPAVIFWIYTNVNLAFSIPVVFICSAVNRVQERQ